MARLTLARLSMLMVLSAAVTAAVASGTRPAPGDAPPPAAPGDHQVEVLFTVNNLGYIDVCGCKHKKVRQGSIARRASYLRQVRARGVATVVLDGGNFLFHNENVRIKDHEIQQVLEKAKVLVEAMNRMDYRAAAVSTYDLTMGIEALREYQKQAKFPFLSANLVKADSGELLFPPTTEFVVNGVKIGVIGLSPCILQQYYLDKRAPGTKVVDHVEAARQYVPGLKARNDVVIALSPNKVEDNQRLAREVPDIDFIIDPFIEQDNHQLWLEDDELTELVDNTFIVRTDSQGARFGVLDLKIAENGRPFVPAGQDPLPEGRSTYAYLRVGIEPHFLEDPEIQLMVDTFKKGTSFVDTARLPELPHKDQYLTVNTCQGCHQEQHQFWQQTKHATAFASLEETGDQWRQDCIGCHVLGYGQTFVAPADAEPYKNVQCESCHGLNPQHPTDPAKFGWERVQELACLTCHNERQTRSQFAFPLMRRQVACPPLKR